MKWIIFARLIILLRLLVITISFVTVPAIAQDGTKGYVGAVIENVDSGGVAVLDIEYGAAFKHDIRPGDAVSMIDGNTINNIDDFISYVSQKPALSTLLFSITRSGQTINKSVVLGPRPVKGGTIAVLGLGLNMGSQDEVGIIVSDVISGSTGAAAGIISGDRIEYANYRTIHTKYDFLTAIKSAVEAGKASTLIRISRPGESKFRFPLLDLPDLAWAKGPYFSSEISDYRFTDWVSLGDWTVTGKVIETGGIWKVTFHKNGSLEFHFSNGETKAGRYRVSNQSICIWYPPDSTEYCRTPQLLNGRIVWHQEENRTHSSEILSVSLRREISKTPAYVSDSNQKPAACRNISSFCSKLALGAAACGFGVQEGANRAFNSDTGALGSAASSALCTGLANSVAGLDVDIIDLAISATSSAFISGAQASFQEGNIGEAILGGLLGLGVGALGVAKCESDLSRACR